MNVRAYWRFLVVARQFLPLLVAYARDRRRFLLFGRRREVSPAQRRQRAAKLLDSMLTLGPTFIKLGQLLSTRPDVLPPEYLAEFTKLQDEVPPADWVDAREVLEEELGTVETRFDSFDTEPISGASLGQVYAATVDGERVAVKIRRPGVEELVATDLRVIRWSLPLLMPFVDEVRSFSLETLADEFDRTIRQEMDYEREADMLREIRSNFEDVDDVRMPAVVESHSTSRVLTMEYVDGTKINDIDRLAELGIDRTQLAERLQTMYIKMIIDDGVFHADPHPGNLAVADDGTLVVYDFGMSGYIDPYVQDNMVEFYTAVVRQDIETIIDALIEIGTLSPDADRDIMRDILELAITDLRGGEVEQYRIQGIIDQIENTIYEFPFRIPADLALVLRVATVVEGVCVALDPEFDFIEASQDYFVAQGYVEEGVRQYVTDRGTEVAEAASASVRIPPKLESVLDRMDRDDLEVTASLRDPDDYLERLARRVVLGVVLAAGIVSTTILAVAATPPAAAVAGVGTLLVGYLLRRSFRSGVTLYASSDVQFTRQRLREGDTEAAALGFGDALPDEDGPLPTHDAMPTVDETGSDGADAAGDRERERTGSADSTVETTASDDRGDRIEVEASGSEADRPASEGADSDDGHQSGERDDDRPPSERDGRQSRERDDDRPPSERDGRQSRERDDDGPPSERDGRQSGERDDGEEQAG